MLLEHAIRTPTFCLHVRAYAFSYTPATYQLSTRNVGNEKNKGDKNQTCSKERGNERETCR